MTLPPHTLAQRAQFRLEAAAFDLGAAGIRALGPDRASALGGSLWRKIAPLNKRHARAEGHLRAAFPEKSDGEIANLLAQMWENLGRTSAEAFHLQALIGAQDRFTIRPGFFEAIRTAQSRGAVFVSLHLGNWELASPLLHHHGLPVAGVYQRLRNPLVDERATDARGPFYARGLYTKGSETARKLLRIAGDGGSVTIMADLRDRTGLPVPFFGRPAPSTIFPALLARGRDVPLFAGVVARQNGATFEADLVEVPVQRTQDREADLWETTAAIQRQFEQFIRARPGQWMWGHRRWQR
ncbi:MAG: lauroyl acyltransferase [Methylobacterium sp.]|nr:lauroyl acyltransferase [Methylobacterium sp.]MCA3610760.1 lauroyl acyltransferase [Methylobacterium sp.]MCA3617370.1 lauroyl acyltransferase [Methylobacterium sp.]MCA3620756.1 lauroyl acyltransferase [Methylobacterium sp.]